MPETRGHIVRAIKFLIAHQFVELSLLHLAAVTPLKTFHFNYLSSLELKTEY
jgi:hypothetical protein